MLETLLLYALALALIGTALLWLGIFLLWALGPALLFVWLLGLALVQTLQRLAQRLQPPAQLR